MVEIVRIPALSDNYVWLVHDAASGETVVIDPAEAAPVLAEAEERGWRIGQIWNTHWHPDHTGGNAAIKDATGAKATGPAEEAARIPTLDRQVGEGDKVSLGAVEAEVFEVPAHTAGHIAYHLPDEKIVFVGDTLFAMGCGRLFEGTAAQMWGSLSRLAALPDETLVCSGHDYARGNGAFALSVDPDNQALKDRLDATLSDQRPASPASLADEKATNPFLRAAELARPGESPLDSFTRLRAAKDSFRG